MKKRFCAKATCITAALLAVATLPNLTYASDSVQTAESCMTYQNFLQQDDNWKQQKKDARTSSDRLNAEAGLRAADVSLDEYKQSNSQLAVPCKFPLVGIK